MDRPAFDREFFARVVREHLAKNGMTQREVAIRAGISRPVLSRILNGQATPSIETVAALSQALGISISQFMGDADRLDYSVRDSRSLTSQEASPEAAASAPAVELFVGTSVRSNQMRAALVGQQKAPRVFLAHAAEDKRSVRELYERLAAQGVLPWLDEVDLLPGQAWQTEIRQAINQSDAVLACLSRNSVYKKGYVQKEFRLALSAYAAKPAGTIYLIPVKLDDTETPDISIPELGVSLRDIQWLDLSAVGGFGRLVEAIRRSASSPAAQVSGRSERDHAGHVPILRRALQEIKDKTHGLYPAIFACVRSGAEHTEAMMREITLRSVESSMHQLSESGLLKFDFASQEPYDNAYRIRVHILDKALLRNIIDAMEGIV